MKKYHLYIYIVALGMIVGATSCDDYLKETSEDLLIPQKVEEFHSLLVGDGYPNSFTNDVMWMDLLTDDVSLQSIVHGVVQHEQLVVVPLSMRTLQL